MQVFATGTRGDLGLRGFKSRITHQQRSASHGVGNGEISLGIRARQLGVGTGSGPELDLCPANRKARRIADGAA